MKEKMLAFHSVLTTHHVKVFIFFFEECYQENGKKQITGVINFNPVMVGDQECKQVLTKFLSQIS